MSSTMNEESGTSTKVERAPTCRLVSLLTHFLVVVVLATIGACVMWWFLCDVTSQKTGQPSFTPSPSPLPKGLTLKRSLRSVRNKRETQVDDHASVAVSTSPFLDPGNFTQNVVHVDIPQISPSSVVKSALQALLAPLNTVLQHETTCVISQCSLARGNLRTTGNLTGGQMMSGLRCKVKTANWGGGTGTTHKCIPHHFLSNDRPFDWNLVNTIVGDMFFAMHGTGLRLYQPIDSGDLTTLNVPSWLNQDLVTATTNTQTALDLTFATTIAGLGPQMILQYLNPKLPGLLKVTESDISVMYGEAARAKRSSCWGFLVWVHCPDAPAAASLSSFNKLKTTLLNQLKVQKKVQLNYAARVEGWFKQTESVINRQASFARFVYDGVTWLNIMVAENRLMTLLDYALSEILDLNKLTEQASAGTVVLTRADLPEMVVELLATNGTNFRTPLVGYLKHGPPLELYVSWFSSETTSTKLEAETVIPGWDTKGVYYYPRAYWVSTGNRFWRIGTGYTWEEVKEDPLFRRLAFIEANTTDGVHGEGLFRIPRGIGATPVLAPFIQEYKECQVWTANSKIPCGTSVKRGTKAVTNEELALPSFTIPLSQSIFGEPHRVEHPALQLTGFEAAQNDISEAYDQMSDDLNAWLPVGVKMSVGFSGLIVALLFGMASCGTGFYVRAGLKKELRARQDNETQLFTEMQHLKNTLDAAIRSTGVLGNNKEAMSPGDREILTTSVSTTMVASGKMEVKVWPAGSVVVFAWSGPEDGKVLLQEQRVMPGTGRVFRVSHKMFKNIAKTKEAWDCGRGKLCDENPDNLLAETST